MNYFMVLKRTQGDQKQAEKSLNDKIEKAKKENKPNTNIYGQKITIKDVEDCLGYGLIDIPKQMI